MHPTCTNDGDQSFLTNRQKETALGNAGHSHNLLVVYNSSGSGAEQPQGGSCELLCGCSIPSHQLHPGVTVPRPGEGETFGRQRALPICCSSSRRVLDDTPPPPPPPTTTIPFYRPSPDWTVCIDCRSQPLPAESQRQPLSLLTCETTRCSRPFPHNKQPEAFAPAHPTLAG